MRTEMEDSTEVVILVMNRAIRVDRVAVRLIFAEVRINFRIAWWWQAEEAVLTANMLLTVVMVGIQVAKTVEWVTVLTQIQANTPQEEAVCRTRAAIPEPIAMAAPLDMVPLVATTTAQLVAVGTMVVVRRMQPQVVEAPVMPRKVLSTQATLRPQAMAMQLCRGLLLSHKALSLTPLVNIRLLFRKELPLCRFFFMEPVEAILSIRIIKCSLWVEKGELYRLVSKFSPGKCFISLSEGLERTEEKADSMGVATPATLTACLALPVVERRISAKHRLHWMIAW